MAESLLASFQIGSINISGGTVKRRGAITIERTENNKNVLTFTSDETFCIVTVFNGSGSYSSSAASSYARSDTPLILPKTSTDYYEYLQDGSRWAAYLRVASNGVIAISSHIGTVYAAWFTI